MKKLILCTLFFVLSSASSIYADTMENISAKFGESASEFVAGLIPGEGITEVDFKFEEKNEPTFSILGVRDIDRGESSNFFTQFSLRNGDYSSDSRLILNYGLGYRTLAAGDSILLGVNAFFDRDLLEEHERGSLGFEARAAALEFNLNNYYELSNNKNVDGTVEQIIGGYDYRLATQIPFMPWAKFSWTGYNHHADKASSDVEGDIYTLGMALTPNLLLDLAKDENHGSSDGDTGSAKFTFVHPPMNSGATLLDGFVSDEFWNREPMQDKLSAKVERNNNMIVEIQGSVIFTKK